MLIFKVALVYQLRSFHTIKLVSYTFIAIKLSFYLYHSFINFIKPLIEHTVLVLSEYFLVVSDSVLKNLVNAFIISIITALISFYSFHPSFIFLIFSSFRYLFLLTTFSTGQYLLIMPFFIKFHFIFTIQSLIFLIQFFIFLIISLILFLASLIQLLKFLILIFLTQFFFNLLLIFF